MQKLEIDFNNWKNAFECKGLKVNMGKTKVMVASGGATSVEEAKIDPCGVCGKRVAKNSITCTVCQKWVHVRCARVKVTERMAEYFVCKICIGPNDKVEITGKKNCT